MKQIITAFFLSMMFSTTNGQVTIKPGDNVIRYDWIKPSHDFYRTVVSDTAGNVKYDFMMEDYTAVDDTQHRITFARSRQIPAGSFSTDTSVTDLNFKPIRMHEIHYQREVAFDMTFGDTQASVTTTRKGQVSVKNYPMKSGYFEDNMIEYIFGYLQIKKEITYTLDNFNKDTPAPSDPYVLEYAFDDTWNLVADHQINCTVLHFTHGGTSGYIWIDKSTHLMIKSIGNFMTGSYLITKL
ncbi:MAG: hypothetical protein ACXVB0_18075 [Mucilaginibacter sp.]